MAVALRRWVLYLACGCPASWVLLPVHASTSSHAYDRLFGPSGTVMPAVKGGQLRAVTEPDWEAAAESMRAAGRRRVECRDAGHRKAA